MSASVSNLVKISEGLHKFYVHHPDSMWMDHYSYSIDKHGVLELSIYLNDSNDVDRTLCVTKQVPVSDNILIECVSEKYWTCFYIIMDDVFERNDLIWEDL